MLSSIALGHEKQWPERRLKQVWPEAQSFTSKQITLTPSQISELKNEGVKVGPENRNPIFYFAQAAGATSVERLNLGVILFTDETGENGRMEISVAVGLDGAIKKIDLWEQSENPLVKKEDFLQQFVGKTVKDSFIANKDYRPVEKALKASEAVAQSARTALKIANLAFQKK